MTVSYASALVGDQGKLIGSHNVNSCERVDTRAYMVNYADTFSAGVGAQATSWDSAAITSVNIMAENTCEVFVRDAGGKSVDGGFTFLVMGTSAEPM